MKRMITETILGSMVLLSGCACGGNSDSKVVHNAEPSQNVRLLSRTKVKLSPTIRIYCIEGYKYVGSYGEGGVTQMYGVTRGKVLPLEC